MKNKILSREKNKKISDLEKNVEYYKETRDEIITNNVKLREEKLLLEKKIKDLQEENEHLQKLIAETNLRILNGN